MVRWPACKNGDGAKKELEEEITSDYAMWPLELYEPPQLYIPPKKCISSEVAHAAIDE
jgi:hypothetical protein